MSTWQSDLVRDSRLVTTFTGEGTKHTTYVSDASNGQRRRGIAQLWRFKGELGSGSFGRVWLEECASKLSTPRVRAVKAISKINSTMEYSRELEAIAKFSHDKYVHCFVRSYGWYEDDESVFIAMEYFKHGDLEKHLHRPLPEAEAWQIASQLTEGLNFMHENGFAHRDLKPANILVIQLAPEWWVKIGDFGISKRAQEGITEFRTMVGTSHFLAPEVVGIFPMEDLDVADRPAEEVRAYTYAVDIWALGQITFLMVCNELAFQRDSLGFNRYVTLGKGFPRHVMERHGASTACCDFVESAMSPSQKRRPNATHLIQSRWLKDRTATTKASQAQTDGIFVDQPHNANLNDADTQAYRTKSVIPAPDDQTQSIVGAEQAGRSDPAATARWSTIAPSSLETMSTSRTRQDAGSDRSALPPHTRPLGLEDRSALPPHSISIRPLTGSSSVVDLNRKAARGGLEATPAKIFYLPPRPDTIKEGWAKFKAQSLFARTQLVWLHLDERALEFRRTEQGNIIHTIYMEDIASVATTNDTRLWIHRRIGGVSRSPASYSVDNIALRHIDFHNQEECTSWAEHLGQLSLKAKEAQKVRKAQEARDQESRRKAREARKVRDALKASNVQEVQTPREALKALEDPRGIEAWEPGRHQEAMVLSPEALEALKALEDLRGIEAWEPGRHQEATVLSPESLEALKALEDLRGIKAWEPGRHQEAMVLPPESLEALKALEDPRGIKAWEPGRHQEAMVLPPEPLEASEARRGIEAWGPGRHQEAMVLPPEPLEALEARRGIEAWGPDEHREVILAPEFENP